jgi:excisionase family DNA binding protein
MGIFDESYSSIELSKILGVHRVTVAKWIKAGALKAVKTPGGRYKVSKANLREFLRETGMPLSPVVGDKRLAVAVDDDLSVLKLLQKMFSRGELAFLYELKTFSNPLEAALFIGDAKPDLVILDLLMPQLDGLSLAKQFRETCPKTRILVVTGHPTHENIAKLREVGVKTVISKPFTMEQLKNAVRA